MDLEPRIEAVRRFNRLYTRQIGVLQEGLLGSDFSLTEVRILYELAHRDQATAADLATDLGLDPGYLSRTLRSFESKALIERAPSPADRRRQIVRLTKAGRRAFAPLDRQAREEIAHLLKPLADGEQRRLLAAMETIASLLGPRESKTGSWLLRDPRPGELGWVVERHGALYFEEYSWDASFEALVAGIVARFAEHHDPQRERCWIAEKDGAPVGSVFLVAKSKSVAQLRLLLVEPEARGLGIGARLVDECIRFARAAGYRKLTLWTNDVLHQARAIYERAGFELVHQAGHHSFGHDLVEQTFDLDLKKPLRRP